MTFVAPVRWRRMAFGSRVSRGKMYLNVDFFGAGIVLQGFQTHTDTCRPQRL